MCEKKIQVSVMLPIGLNEKLKTLAVATTRTKSAYIRQILRRYLQYLQCQDPDERAAFDWQI